MNKRHLPFANTSLDHPPPSTQVRQPWTLTSPPSISQARPSYDAAEFQDIDTSALEHVPTVNTAFIEAVAQSMGFQTADEDYQSSLHSIPTVRHARTYSRSTLLLTGN